MPPNNDISRLRRVLKSTLRDKQNRIQGDDGLLGDGSGVVATGDPNMVYVRVAGGVVARVYNDRAPLQHDLPVKIGFDPLHPSRLRVLDHSGVPVYGQESADYINVANHAATHRFPLGRDTIWVEGRQFMPLRLSPIPGTLTVHLYPGVVKLPGGTYQEITGAVYDLTSYVPATSGKARYTLITINDAGTVTFTAGTEVDIADLDATTVPTAPANTAYELGMVRTYYGQTEIIEAVSDTDIWDLRFPMPHNHGTSGGALALDDLTDVDTTGVTDGQAIIWDNGTSTWVPGSAGTGSDLGLFNVKDYGAVGNGVANDTTAVQDALDAAAAAGGIVWLPPGTYLCGPLTIYPNVSIIGSGMDTSTIKASAAGALLSYHNTANLTVFTGKLQEFTLDGNSTGGTGLYLTGVFQFSIQRMTIRRFTTAGVHLRGSLVAWFYDCSIEFCVVGIKAESYTLSVTGYVQTNLVNFTNTRVLWNTSWGVFWQGGAMVAFVGCDIGGNGTNGNAGTGNIYYAPRDDSFGLKVQNCWMEGNTGKAVILIDTPAGPGEYSVIEDTVIQLSTTTYGIYVEGSVRTNNVVCRTVTFYSDCAGGDFFANGAGATIYLNHCVGTTGGTGAVIDDTHAAVTVADTTTIDLSLSGQQVSAALKDTTVTPGTYTNATVTVDQQGRITSAETGSGGSAGELLVADNTTPLEMLTNEAEDDYLFEG